VTEAVEVEQIDRDAAADYTVEQLGEHDYLEALLADMREGRADGSKLVQSFARHRIAARADLLARIEALEDGLRGMLRLADMGFAESMVEPEERGNYAAYNRACELLALSPIKDRNNAG
jgi:hypothetical protein